ncbi:MAG: YbaK/EbsC family protein [Candidatus Aenigmatarchaeota archaeon]
MLTQDDLINFLENRGIWYIIHEKESTVHTADAAAKTGIPLERIVKSLVCINEKPIVCIIPGNCRLDLEKVEKIVGSRVKVCPFKDAHKFSGYEPGATPPCFYENIEMVIVDKKVLENTTIFGGGGTNTSLIEMRPQDVVGLNRALVGDIVG